MNTKYITAKELKKIMQTAIKIDVELGFYISYSGMYIEIDRFENNNRNKIKFYEFKPTEFKGILEHIQAYSRLYKHNLHLV